MHTVSKSWGKYGESMGKERKRERGHAWDMHACTTPVSKHVRGGGEVIR